MPKVWQYRAPDQRLLETSAIRTERSSSPNSSSSSNDRGTIGLCETQCLEALILLGGVSSGEVRRLGDSLNIKDCFPESGVLQESSQKSDRGGFEDSLAQAEEGFFDPNLYLERSFGSGEVLLVSCVASAAVGWWVAGFVLLLAWSLSRLLAAFQRGRCLLRKLYLDPFVPRKFFSKLSPQRLPTLENLLFIFLKKKFLSLKRFFKEPSLSNVLMVGLLSQRWLANFDYDKDPSMMPIWVGFPGLPVSLYNEDYLRSVANNLGQVLRIHDTTLAWTQTAEALVCIDVDIAAPLQHKIWIGYGDQGFWQKVNYHRVPPLCKFCCHVGHSEDSCFKKNKKPMPPQSTKSVGAFEVVAQPAQEWRPIRGHKKKVVDVTSDIPVSNAFERLRDDVGELVTRVEDRVAGDDCDGVIQEDKHDEHDCVVQDDLIPAPPNDEYVHDPVHLEPSDQRTMHSHADRVTSRVHGPATIHECLEATCTSPPSLVVLHGESSAGGEDSDGSSLLAEIRAMADGVRLAEEKGIRLSQINSDSKVSPGGVITYHLTEMDMASRGRRGVPTHEDEQRREERVEPRHEDQGEQQAPAPQGPVLPPPPLVDYGVFMQGLVQTLQTQAHTQAALQA
ncbi:hypothetical protein Taro_035982 [Colocasia esculenta]|uniref:DUF4283 domain-containing protein n=1 Tax=Colocasia esculenta TaxID=4460 RepID=A0A843WGF3_COLES|nr:hypothetical protein [Colocasia esculenta]